MPNPLFPAEEPKKPAMSLPPVQASKGASQAAELIRHKLAKLYAKEPNATKELQEAAVTRPRSKHQQYMYELGQSGKSLSEIQAAWHDYYLDLADHEKYEVWQEFYQANAEASHYQKYQQEHADEIANGQIHGRPVVGDHSAYLPPELRDSRSPQIIQRQIRHKVTSRIKPATRSRLKSLAFGLALGCLVVIIFLFGFFNEVIIAPFIQPSRHASNTPLIVTSAAVTGGPEVIIPKINVEIPVDYSQTSDDEDAIETALESGVVHYPSTVLPGQNGNAAFFGHSSNNIFNPGKYKFAFVLLHTLVDGDTFYLTYNGTRYTYQVIDTRIVSPSDVAVLNDTEGQTATATLITCDPPGTSNNRLVVTGEQISPDPNANVTPENTPTIAPPTVLANNGPSLWSRFWNWAF